MGKGVSVFSRFLFARSSSSRRNRFIRFCFVVYGSARLFTRETSLGGVPREQTMLKDTYPELYITKYTSIRRLFGSVS